jgi:hypothetical protein
VRLAVRDDESVSVCLRFGGQTVGEPEQLDERCSRALHRVPRGLGQRAARPGLVPLLQRRLEVTTPGQVEAARARQAFDKR